MTLQEQLEKAEYDLDKANDRLNDHYAFYGDCDMSEESNAEWFKAFSDWTKSDLEVKHLKTLIKGEKV